MGGNKIFRVFHGESFASELECAGEKSVCAGYKFILVVKKLFYLKCEFRTIAVAGGASGRSASRAPPTCHEHILDNL